MFLKIYLILINCFQLVQEKSLRNQQFNKTNKGHPDAVIQLSTYLASSLDSLSALVSVRQLPIFFPDSIFSLGFQIPDSSLKPFSVPQLNGPADLLTYLYVSSRDGDTARGLIIHPCDQCGHARTRRYLSALQPCTPFLRCLNVSWTRALHSIPALSSQSWRGIPALAHCLGRHSALYRMGTLILLHYIHKYYFC